MDTDQFSENCSNGNTVATVNEETERESEKTEKFPSREISERDSSSENGLEKSIPKQLLFSVWFSKLLGNTCLRIFYPLAPFLTEDWNLSRSQMAWVLAAAEIAGGPSFLFAPLGDIYGNRLMALTMWFLAVLGAYMILLPKLLLLLLLARITFNFGYTMYQISAQSVVVTQVPLEKRDWATGMVESSWSVSVLVMIPVLSYVYSELGDVATFSILATLMSLSFLVLFRIFPSNSSSAARTGTCDEDEDYNEGERENESEIEASFRNACFHCMTTAVVLFSLSCMCWSISHNAIFTAFAFWAKDEFAISIEKLGSSLFVVGAAELLGVFCVSYFSTIIGVYRSLYLMTAWFCIAIVSFMFSPTYGVGLIIIFFVYVAGEYVIVLTIAEAEAYVKPEFRTTILGIHFTVQFIGRSLGALIGESLYEHNSLVGVCSVSAAIAIVSGILLLAAEKNKPEFSTSFASTASTSPPEIDGVGNESEKLEITQT